jgi:hypothetical protein
VKIYRHRALVILTTRNHAHAQWAKSRGCWLATRCQQPAAFGMGRNRLYFLRIHRIR